jgi:hypothetical protein
LVGASVSAFVPGADSMAPVGGATMVPLEVDDALFEYPFGAKVLAAARAEEIASENEGSLVWMSPQCLVVGRPDLLRLSGGARAALRPVHIRNVGSRADGPPDEYWAAVYRSVGLDDASWSVTSLVDPEVIRPYYNTHLFSVDPKLGLMRSWLDRFRAMVADAPFQAGTCSDPVRKVFLHQAVLSALVTKVLGWERILELPLEYSYPLHFHGRVPPSVRPRALNDLICPVYEGAYEHPATLGGLAVEEPLRAWLEEHARR